MLQGDYRKKKKTTQKFLSILYVFSPWEKLQCSKKSFILHFRSRSKEKTEGVEISKEKKKDKDDKEEEKDKDATTNAVATEVETSNTCKYKR